jgi:hypothetical protein
MCAIVADRVGFGSGMPSPSLARSGLVSLQALPMTAKHNARVARDNLYVTKQRAASAKTDPKKRSNEARQLAMQANVRTTRALTTFLANLSPESATVAELERSERIRGSEGTLATPPKVEPEGPRVTQSKNPTRENAVRVPHAKKKTATAIG